MQVDSPVGRLTYTTQVLISTIIVNHFLDITRR